MTASAVFETLKRSFRPIQPLSGLPACFGGANLIRAPKLKEKNFDEVYEIPAGHRFNSRFAAQTADALAHVVVADYVPLAVIVVAPKPCFLHRQSLPIVDCFHGHFCLGAWVVAPQHGGCSQPWVTSVSFELT
jgi:hypothetical protein